VDVVDLGLEALEDGVARSRWEKVGAGLLGFELDEDSAQGWRVITEPVACLFPDAAPSRRHGVRGDDNGGVEMTEALLPIVLIDDTDADDSVRMCDKWLPDGRIVGVLVEAGWAAELLRANLDVRFSPSPVLLSSRAASIANVPTKHKRFRMHGSITG
jgi:hypothetical protein